MSRRRLRATLLCASGLLGLSTGAWLRAINDDAPLPSGVQLAGYSLGGVRPSQLHRHLETLQAILAEQPVIVVQAPHYQTHLNEWGIALDAAGTHRAVLDAWARVPPWKRLFGKPRLRVQPQWTVALERFQTQLACYRWLARAPCNARARWVHGGVQIVPSREGRTLDCDASVEALLHALRHVPVPQITFALALTSTPPRVSTEHAHAITGVISHYTTRFPAYQRSRNHNIRLAANALDGHILLPGERLSYNEVVGKRTRQQGFRLAPAIIRGEKRDAIGGGICQVSSTLFNAALLGELKIVRRANHSIPVAYVPLGRDATVTDTGIDFVVENPHPYPIAIATEVGRSSLTIYILGQMRTGRTVVLKTERGCRQAPPVRRVPDPSLPLGKERVLRKGAAGECVVLWREVYANGSLVKRERVATSVYRAQPRVIAVGVKPAVPPSASATCATNTADQSRAHSTGE